VPAQVHSVLRSTCGNCLRRNFSEHAGRVLSKWELNLACARALLIMPFINHDTQRNDNFDWGTGKREPGL